MKFILIIILTIFKFEIALANEKIAFIDLNFIINNSVAGKSITTFVDNLSKEKNNDFKVIENEIRKDENELISKKNIIEESIYNKKVNEMARRKLTHIPLREGRTIHHDVKAKDGSGRIVLRAASKGTGIIAGGPVRAVCEVLGVKDIVAKSMGTSNAHNVIRATMKALMKQSSPKQISAIRNKKISEIIEKRG